MAFGVVIWEHYRDLNRIYEGKMLMNVTCKFVSQKIMNFISIGPFDYPTNLPQEKFEKKIAIIFYWLNNNWIELIIIILGCVSSVFETWCFIVPGSLAKTLIWILFEQC